MMRRKRGGSSCSCRRERHGGGRRSEGRLGARDLEPDDHGCGRRRSMRLTRQMVLAGTAAGLAARTGGEDKTSSRFVAGCDAPAGTTSRVFAWGERQLFGFVDGPRSDGPFAAVLLVRDAGA